MELALISQKPLSLILFKVMPLPQCAALRWDHVTTNSVTLDFFGRIMGCIYSSFNPDLLIRPPTLIMLFPSINGNTMHLLCLSFFPAVSTYPVHFWSVLLELIWLCYRLPLVAILHLLMQWTPCCLLLLHSFVWSFVITKWATTFFIFSQLGILPSSCDSRSCLMVMTFTATAGFISGSTSLTYVEIWFGLWSSGWLRKLGPLNHLCNLLDLIPPRRLELSSAGLHADGT